ncbi:MAG: Dabb family protein [Acidobacteriota bacterium]
MIRHVVCFKLKDSSLIPQWQRDSEMLASIETVESFSAVPVLKQDRFHCALYMEFEDRAALQIYQDHGTHKRYLAEILPPIVADKLVVDLLESE